MDTDIKCNSMPSAKRPIIRKIFTAAALIIMVGIIGLSGMFHYGQLSAGSAFSAVFADGGVRVERDRAYGPHDRHRLDIYRPADGADTGPVVVFFYGGGWRDGEREAYGFVGSALAARGITTVIPDYRLHPEVLFPAFVEDAAHAYRWVAENLAGSAGTSRPIVLMGHSAGAHIAAILAVDGTYVQNGEGRAPPPAGFIGLAGPYSFDPTTFDTTKEIFAAVTDASRARPTELVTAKAPPALVIHGLADETVKPWNTRTFAEALGKAGVPVTKLEYPGIGHAGLVLTLSQPFRWRAPVLSEIVEFIDRIKRTVP